MKARRRFVLTAVHALAEQTGVVLGANAELLCRCSAALRLRIL